VPGSRVEVVWDVVRDAEGKRRLSLEWTERDGPPVEPPSRKGFGSTLLERVLPAQCHAEVALEFDPAGLSFRMKAPLIEERLVPSY
jgi:two-component sensor histidine kinase